MATASVLIVDDNEVDRYLLKRQLKGTQFDFEIFEQNDGSTALAFLKNYDENRVKYPGLFPPLIIFLDINMPVMKGQDFLVEFSKIRGKVYASSCVIMMFTSSERSEDMDDAMKFDFVKDYLVKGSFDSAELDRRIRRVTAL